MRLSPHFVHGPVQRVGFVSSVVVACPPTGEQIAADVIETIATKAKATATEKRMLFTLSYLRPEKSDDRDISATTLEGEIVRQLKPLPQVSA